MPKEPRGTARGKKSPSISPVEAPLAASAKNRPLPGGEAALALSELAAISCRAETVADAQKAQLAVIQALLEAKGSYMLELLHASGTLGVACVRGRNDERICAAPLGEGVAGSAFSTRTVGRGGGLLAIPLVAPEETFGCAVVIEPRADLPDALLLAFGAQMATAWAFARVKDDAARRNKDLQTAIAGLKSLEKNREELLSNVSHDLKNPLTTIKAYLTMLEQGKLGALEERQRQAVQKTERNADRLLKMVNDLLLISRLQSGKMQLDERPFGLKALVNEVLQTLSSLADVSKVRLTLPRCPEVFVKGDRERLTEALHNLVEHAIHRTPADGEVEVSVAAGDGLATVAVRDQGEALGKEQLGHLFESFHRPRSVGGDRGGEGLGLPIVAKVAQLHGGRVAAGTGPSGGTTLELVLPAFAAAVSLAEAQEPPRAGDILLVEDDKDCREVLQEVLEAEGYRVLSTSEVDEAQRLLGQSRPAMVLLDLRLSHEDGRSVLHHIRGTPELEGTAVYLISGASEVGSLAAGTGLDRIDGFFEKPLQLSRLLDTVASVVRPAQKAP